MAAKSASTRRDPIKWILLVGCVVGIAVAYYYLGRPLIIRYFAVEPDFNRYPVRGIDVSNHNGDIDWEQVAGENYRFAYIKASEGVTYRDPRFRANADAARKQGLKVGAYHFFRNDREGLKQAENFLDAVDGIDLDLPMVIDVEDTGNDRSVEPEVIGRRLQDMIKRLQDSKRRVMIYTNGDGYQKFYKPRNSHLDLWLSSFRSPDEIKESHHPRIQQFSHWGEVAGIDGNVDLNIFVGSAKEWDSWTDYD